MAGSLDLLSTGVYVGSNPAPDAIIHNHSTAAAAGGHTAMQDMDPRRRPRPAREIAGLPVNRNSWFAARRAPRPATWFGREAPYPRHHHLRVVARRGGHVRGGGRPAYHL